MKFSFFTKVKDRGCDIIESEFLQPVTSTSFTGKIKSDNPQGVF